MHDQLNILIVSYYLASGNKNMIYPPKHEEKQLQHQNSNYYTKTVKVVTNIN